jgi:hypothetical protein
LVFCRAGCARLFQKTLYFVIVSLEWVAHEQKIAAVAGDGIPIDDVRDPAGAGLEKGNCPRAT